MARNVSALKRIPRDTLLIAMLRKMGYSPDLAAKNLPAIKNQLGISNINDFTPEALLKKVNEKALTPEFVNFMNKSHEITYAPRPIPTPAPQQKLEEVLELRAKPLPSPFNTRPY